MTTYQAYIIDFLPNISPCPGASSPAWPRAPAALGSDGAARRAGRPARCAGRGSPASAPSVAPANPKDVEHEEI